MNARNSTNKWGPSPLGKGIPRASHDEYPFASTREGGAGAWVGPVPVAEHSQQGKILRDFYQSFGYVAGTRFRVVVVE